MNFFSDYGFVRCPISDEIETSIDIHEFEIHVFIPSKYIIIFNLNQFIHNHTHLIPTVHAPNEIKIQISQALE